MTNDPSDIKVIALIFGFYVVMAILAYLDWRKDKNHERQNN